jgi:hypothetical protein
MKEVIMGERGKINRRPLFIFAGLAVTCPL